MTPRKPPQASDKDLIEKMKGKKRRLSAKVKNNKQIHHMGKPITLRKLLEQVKKVMDYNRLCKRDWANDLPVYVCVKEIREEKECKVYYPLDQVMAGCLALLQPDMPLTPISCVEARTIAAKGVVIYL